MAEPRGKLQAAEWHRDRWTRALDFFGLDPTSRRIALALSTFADRHGRAYPGLVSLATRAGLNKATVARRAAELESAGWIRRQPGGGRRRTTRYQLTIPETVALRLDQITSSEPEQPDLFTPIPDEVRERMTALRSHPNEASA